MYASIELLFHDAADEQIDVGNLDCYKFNSTNYKYLNISANATSIFICAIYYNAIVPACIIIKFYSAEDKFMGVHHMHLSHNSDYAWKKIEIPQNSAKLCIRFVDYKTYINCV